MQFFTLNTVLDPVVFQQQELWIFVSIKQIIHLHKFAFLQIEECTLYYFSFSFSWCCKYSTYVYNLLRKRWFRMKDLLDLCMALLRMEMKF